MRRSRTVFAGFVARMEDARLPKCLIFGELVGGAGCVGRQGKKWMGCFLDDLKSFRYQRQPVYDSSQGRGGMAQDGGTRCVTFHGENDRCRESQGWTAVCSSTPERDRKDQGGHSPKQACSWWFTRHSSFATSRANLYPPGVFFSVVTFFVFAFPLLSNLFLQQSHRPSFNRSFRDQILRRVRGHEYIHFPSSGDHEQD